MRIGSPVAGEGEPQPLRAVAGRPIRVPMRGRATDEVPRASTPLELFFDLTFVVGVARITSQFAHRIADGHGLEAITPFLLVFFAVWWAWMNFTWFASSYDTDDVPYRLLTLVQMAGVLVLAAGVPAAFNRNDFLGITLGYLIMRTGLIALWIRAGIEDPPGRATAFRYAGGIMVLDVAWVLRLVAARNGVVPEASLLPIFLSLVLLELAVPMWAERKRPTSWHPHHIAERYGLFAILLLGECMVGASEGVEAVLEHGGASVGFASAAVAGLVLLFALWWLYFLEPAGERLARNREGAWRWGLGQYGVFAALAALGAGLELAVEQTGHLIAVSPFAVGYAIGIPVAAFLVLLWLTHMPITPRLVIPPWLTLSAAAVILVVPATAGLVGVTGVLAATATVCVTVIVVTLAVASPMTGQPAPRT